MCQFKDAFPRELTGMSVQVVEAHEIRFRHALRTIKAENQKGSMAKMPLSASADGRYVAFSSPSSNFVEGDSGAYETDRDISARIYEMIDNTGNKWAYEECSIDSIRRPDRLDVTILRLFFSSS